MKRFSKYLIVPFIGICAVALFVWSRDIFAQTDAREIFKILCDAFFIPGILICAAGLIVLSSNEGAFDAISYGLTSFINMFKRDPSKKYDSFYDYTSSRSEKKTPFAFLLITGGGFLLVSMIMWILYANV